MCLPLWVPVRAGGLLGGKEACLTIPSSPYPSFLGLGTMIACLSLNYLYFHFEAARRGNEGKEGHVQPFILRIASPLPLLLAGGGSALPPHPLIKKKHWFLEASEGAGG